MKNVKKAANDAAKIGYDHSKKNVLEAMGLVEPDLRAKIGGLVSAEFSRDGENFSSSKFAESFENNLTTRELAFLASKFIVEDLISDGAIGGE